jgi:hypothetical protein
MTAALILVAAVIIGGLVGSFLTMTVTAATVSRSQERMERKVRYWQTETAKARRAARHALPPAQDDRLAGGEDLDR